MMTYRPSTFHVLLTVGLACIFWAVIFGTTYVNFWVGMSCASLVLAFFSFIFGGIPFCLSELSWRALFLGIFSAIILYGIFYIGNAIATKIFVFAPDEVADIYTVRHEGKMLAILGVLLFITSPAEEIFWRGFLQRWAIQHLGSFWGWLLAGLVYAGVHIFSGNIMLVLAAAVAGLFWGFLYWLSGSLVPCIISHALWTSVIFIFFPIGK